VEAEGMFLEIHVVAPDRTGNETFFNEQRSEEGGKGRKVV
jgi:hypothetical protein